MIRGTSGLKLSLRVLCLCVCVCVFCAGIDCLTEFSCSL
jgi:hypothetical protein